jgi:hypothetical protein
MVGEAEIAKSRLLLQFHDDIRDTPHLDARARAQHFFEKTSFHAITEMLSQWLELQGARTPKSIWSDWWRAIFADGCSFTEGFNIAGLREAKSAARRVDRLSQNRRRQTS